MEDPLSPNDASDEKLMESVQKGSYDSLKELYDRYSGKMFRYAYFILKNKHNAEDCVQDVFMKLHDKAATYKPGKRFSPWIYRIARHTALNLIRDEKIGKMVSLDEPLGPEEQATLEKYLKSDDVGPAQSLAGKEVSAAVRLAIQSLGERDRAVIMLCGIQGISNPEAAQILGWPTVRVTLQLSRAKNRLAALIRSREESRDKENE